MNQSEHINELAAALSKAQGEFPAIPKTRIVDFVYNSKKTYYKYADLSDVIDAIKGPLTKYGLSHSEQLVYAEGKVILWTRLMHSSGQWLLSLYPITLGSKPQESGSAISYARRYALTALVGVQAEEDNDAQSAPDLGKGNQEDEDDEKPDNNFKTFKAPVISPVGNLSVIGGWNLKDVNKAYVLALAKDAGITLPQLLAGVKTKFNIDTLEQLTQTQYDKLISKLKIKIEESSVK